MKVDINELDETLNQQHRDGKAVQRHFILILFLFLIVTSASQAQDSREELQQSCDADETFSCNKLGISYYFGGNTGSNYETIPLIHPGGTFGPLSVDRAKALDLFKKACDANYANSCNNVGVIYFLDDNYTKAIAIFEQACDADVSDSCSALGYCYLHGLGVEKDKAKAKKLLKKAVMLLE